jgi:hypothetical protein
VRWNCKNFWQLPNIIRIVLKLYISIYQPKILKYRGNAKYPSKCLASICPAVGSTGVISVRYQVSLRFVFVLIYTGSSGYKFKGFLNKKQKCLEPVLRFDVAVCLIFLTRSKLTLLHFRSRKQSFYDLEVQVLECSPTPNKIVRVCFIRLFVCLRYTLYLYVQYFMECSFPN